MVERGLEEEMNCKEKAERKLNNLYQIQEEFECKKVKCSMYHPPRKSKIKPKYPPSSRVKIYSEEEKYLYEVNRLINNLTVCGN